MVRKNSCWLLKGFISLEGKTINQLSHAFLSLSRDDPGKLMKKLNLLLCRYRLRGAKTVVFYAPPSHPSYYPEFLSFPFTSPSSSGPGAPLTLDPEVEVDESELSSHVVFSKFDLLKLERIVGTKDARRMCGIGSNEAGKNGGESRFTFV